MVEDNSNNEVILDTSQLTSNNSNLISFNFEETPITDIVNIIILDAIKNNASDIHFDPTGDGLKIRIRIDGNLFDYSLVPLYVQKNMITRIKIIAGMNITESRVPQDGAIKNQLDNTTVDLRVSSLPTNIGEKIVIRILDYSMSAAGLEELDFNKQNLDKIYKMIAQPNGIILVTGATGTGKTTTVYSILQKLNTEDRNIISVEDPIEMSISGINQVQVISDIGLSFANVLRSVLRQDPDIIMIGEIRDDETARIAVRASITGHLVLSTIHTNNSLNTIERLLDMEVERYLLGSALAGIISQKLARKLCKKCRGSRQTNQYEKDIFKKTLNIDVDSIYTAVGCPECHAGYAGRIAIHEVLRLNQEIQDAITSSQNKETLRKLVYSSGTITMLQDGLAKVVEGQTTFEEILKLIDLEDDLGSKSNLGLEQTIEDSMTNNKNRDYDILDI
ncbi:MAG: GspE/PulE family protein [Bacilli bacterium]|nr:GspE/PulE family protein [Bacilli bacterium]